MSLTISRRRGEKVLIDGRISVVVSELTRSQCRLTIDAPDSVPIVREEAKQRGPTIDEPETAERNRARRAYKNEVALKATRAAVDCALAHLRAASTWGANSAERHGHLADAQRVLEEARR